MANEDNEDMDLDSGLIVVIGGVIVVAPVLFRRFANSVTSYLALVEVNVFYTGFIVSLLDIIIVASVIFLIILLLAIGFVLYSWSVKKMDPRTYWRILNIWNRTKFRYNHPHTSMFGVFYLSPKKKKPGEEILEELNED